MGAHGARRVTTLEALLRLARVSNLPTVWSNVLAASVLAAPGPADGMAPAHLAVVLVAMSAMYTGGMVLNDAFDREIDARERPERPLPSGAIASATAWTIGGGLLALGVALLASFGLPSALAGLALASAIVLYDAWHKGNTVSPLIMGTCRALVYVGTALAAGTALNATILGAALALLLYIAGLTRAAKGGAFQSLATSWPVLLLLLPLVTALAGGAATALAILLAAVAALALGWAVRGLRSGDGPDRERAIGLLIAAIALLDAVVAAAHGSPAVALVCVALFAATLALQRVVAGT